MRCLAILAPLAIDASRLPIGDPWQPLVPPIAGELGMFGWSAVLGVVGVVLLTLVVLDVVSVSARRAGGPRYDVPVRMLGPLLVCTIVYIAVALSL